MSVAQRLTAGLLGSAYALSGRVAEALSLLEQAAAQVVPTSRIFYLSTSAAELREMDMRFWLEQAEAELKALGSASTKKARRRT